MSELHAHAVDPPNLGALIAEARLALPALVDLVVADIQAQVSVYAGAEKGERHRVIASAVTAAANQFLDAIGGPTSPDPEVARLFREMGYEEALEGHTLEPMRRSLRIATRHSWSLIHQFATANSFDAAFLGRLGDALFSFLDYLDQEVARGHQTGKLGKRSDRERARAHLISQILTESSDSNARLSELTADAESAGWRLPLDMVLMRVTFHGEFPHFRLPEDVLVEADTSPALVICSSRQAQPIADLITRSGPGLRVAMSWPLRPTQGAAADRWVRRALNLVDTGVISPVPILACRDYATQLWLHAEPHLRRQLTLELLQPLLAETPNSREILAETMLAWLESRDSAPAIAARLGVHPQTVRYRWKRINELFGELLHDPEYVVTVTMLLKATVPMWKAGDLSDVNHYRTFQGPQ
ncbi:helix-turn-helix domain-containing protein [Nocardioides sp. Bht2]|uniref:PucR family transcriptional regulator n=1 Tax=Nocardioides sp. Bht2 TaxID=3392297 RepID=UPI0039B53C71